MKAIDKEEEKDEGDDEGDEEWMKFFYEEFPDLDEHANQENPEMINTSNENQTLSKIKDKR